MEGTTTKERIHYVNEARRVNYPAIATRPPTSRGGLVFFSEEDVYSVHFSHNNALVVTVYIGCCKVSKILVDGRSNINILYGHALDRMEDTLLTRKLIIPRPSYFSTILTGAKPIPRHGRVPSPCDPFNVVTEFCVLNVQFPYNAILGRPWIHMMRAISSTHHQVMKYPTPSGRPT